MRNLKTVLLIPAACAAGILLSTLYFRRDVAPQLNSSGISANPSAPVVDPVVPLPPVVVPASPVAPSRPEKIPLITGGAASDILWTDRTPAALRVRRIFPDEKLMASEPVLKVGDHITLALFDDAVLDAEVSNVTRYPNGSVGMTAHLRNGREGTVFLSYSGGQMRASVKMISGADFYVKYDPETRSHYVVEVDHEHSVVLEGAEPLIPPADDAVTDELAASTSAEPAVLADAPLGATIVDVMIVYTPAARIAEGGTDGINNNINLAMQKANTAHTNSNTQVYLNLVHRAEVNYTEVDYSTDLDNLTFSGGTNSAMDEVQSWRDQYGADMVCLLENEPGTGGVGWLLRSSSGRPDLAFCLARVQQSDSTYTVVHEWGHNMGCGHSRTQTFQPGTNGLYSYSSGWQWSDTKASPYTGYCSVMTYENFDNTGPNEYIRVGYFSNPSINYIGNSTNATGNSTNGNNALTIRTMKTVLAGYRTSMVLPSVTLSLSGSPMAESGGVATVTATLSATYSQPVTVNLAFSGSATPVNDYTLSRTNIVIDPGSTTSSLTLTAVQDALYESNEAIIVDISSVVNGTESGTQQVTATIADDDFELTILPSAGVSFVGPTNGVTSPANQVYVLTNAGTSTLSWTAFKTNSWIVLSAAGGTLAAGAATNVTVSATIGALAEGTYSGAVTFSNTTRGVSVTRPVSLTVTPQYVYFFPLDTNPGWTMQGEWAFGRPTGQGDPPDPTGGFSGNNVFGVNLNGNYSTSQTAGPYYLTAGPFDFSGYTNVSLHFQRWLNTDWGMLASSTVEVSSNGTTWALVYTNDSYSEVLSESWSRQTNNISFWADRQATVYVRWGCKITVGAWPRSGWNIDDIGFLGTAISSDADSDGIPDGWELQHFGGITNASAVADADGDGFSNLQEYIAGSNPTNGQSFFGVSSFELPAGGAVIRWNAVTGRVYGVHRATNLLNSFLPLATNIVWPQSSYTDTVHGTELHNFYEIKVRLSP